MEQFDTGVMILIQSTSGNCPLILGFHLPIAEACLALSWTRNRLTPHIPKVQNRLPRILPLVPFQPPIIKMSAPVQSTQARPNKRARLFNTGDVPPLQCQVCHRTYERADHLNRHLDSRKNLELLAQCIIFTDDRSK
jgi:hypothetical protein